jgi:GNAT superfamily N-acetyltransferase
MKVLMWRKDLENIPGFSLPVGFSCRWYQQGDEVHWRRIDRSAHGETEATPDLFSRDFGSHRALLAQRQCYLLTEDCEPIGTATAWFDDHFQGARFGRVHYVAIVREYQRRGLSKPLMTAVCNRLRELGHDRAYLATSTAWPRAINLYLRFGFVPLLRNQEEGAAWNGLGVIGETRAPVYS